MEMTGLVFQVASGTTVSLIFIVSFFAINRFRVVISSAEALGNEFAALWKNCSKSELAGGGVKLVSLSHTYRALKKQLEREGELDEELLEESLKKTKDKMSRLSRDEMRNLYYGAWRKFKNLEKRHKEGQ